VLHRYSLEEQRKCIDGGARVSIDKVVSGCNCSSVKFNSKYRKRHSVLLSRVDTDKAPDIAWPDKPEWVRDCMNDNNQHKLR
jgi:hypothetical protein